MGVHGLWKLIEPSGKPVPLETLENKVLAVDVSIWLHQAIKGFQDARGGTIPNAHLLGIYHRVCKLLYFKIKPVFVFDGGVPALKRETITKRNQIKAKNFSEANKIQKQLLNTLLKHSAVNKVLSEKAKSQFPISSNKIDKKPQDDLYVLPPTELDSTISSSEEEEEEYSSYTTSDSSPTKHWDLHTIDEKSAQFKALPVDVRHEILTELKETRKQSSWGRIHELPTQSDDFSGYQMKRLLKRYSVQVSLEETEKEMGGHSLSLNELESLLNDQGIITEDKIKSRIASDENTRYLFIKDVKKTLEKARIDAANQESNEEEKIEKVRSPENEDLKNDDEFQRDLAKAIQLSLEETPSTSKFLLNDSIIQSIQSDSSDEEVEVLQMTKEKYSAAKSYMMEYSSLTPQGIEEILGTNKSKKSEKSSHLIKKSKVTLSTISEEIDSEVSKEQKKEMKDESIVSTITEESKKVSNKEDKNESISKNKFNGIANGQNETSSTSNDSMNLISLDQNKEKSVEIALMSDSESSDSFIEVSNDAEKEEISNKTSISEVLKEDLTKPDLESSDELIKKVCDREELVPKPVEKKLFEIVIKEKNLELEDDMFSDIFNDIEQKSSNVTELIDSTIREKVCSKPTSNLINKDQDNVMELNKSKIENSNEINITKPKNLETNQLAKEIVEMVEGDVQNPSELTTEQLQKIQTDLQTEKRDLISEIATKERMANNITDQMYQEAQELLQLFGVPYIIAPMEAEAQCAFLDEINLTDGTITDDSDIWLFGGKTVYKNFFNQTKHVLEFRSENIHHHFKLSRQQLILLALLVGSDYTTGLQGVGPVTALEILAAFPPKDFNEEKAFWAYHDIISGLLEFRSWYQKGNIPGIGRATLRNKLKNVNFTESFPSLNVIRAYLEPEVETSKDEFSWGKPDITALTEYAKHKFGWSAKKSDEILKPVIKRMNESRIQSTIKDYFSTKHKIIADNVQEKVSKRVKKALNQIGNPGEENVNIEESKKKNSRTKVHKQGTTKEVSEKNSQENKIAPEKNDSVVLNVNPQKKAQNRKKRENIEEILETPEQKIAKLAQKRLAGISTQKEKVVNKKNTKKIRNVVKPPIQNSTQGTKITKNEDSNAADTPSTSSKIDMDEDIKILLKTQAISKQKVVQIRSEVKEQIEKEKEKRRPNLNVLKKEIIPQREKDRFQVMRNKMKAIETFRKSKSGPGYVKKRQKLARKPKSDAELSESSSDE